MAFSRQLSIVDFVGNDKPAVVPIHMPDDLCMPDLHFYSAYFHASKLLYSSLSEMLYNILDEEEEYRSFYATKIGTIKVEIWHAKIIG
jgi:hypothetical protein